jgi:prevent-host-death family protein
MWSFLLDHVCYNVTMKTIGAATFKARCLTLMEDVRSTRRPLVITKRGKPVAKLVPVDDPKDEFIGRLKGVFEVVGDLEDYGSEPWESAI